MQHRRLFVVVPLLLFGALSSARAQRYTVQALPSTPIALNDKGEVLCDKVLWKNGGTTVLHLSEPDSVPYGLNNASEVVSGYARFVSGDPPFPQPHISCAVEFWNGSRVTPVDTIYVVPPPFVTETAGGINDHEHIALVLNNTTANASILSLWKPDGRTDTTINGNTVLNAAINNSDLIAGTLQSGTVRAFVLNGGTVQMLPEGYEANGIDDTGRVAGSYLANSTAHACTWDDGQRTPLPELSRTTSSKATSSNEKGWTVGSCSLAGSERAVLWHDGAARNLNTLISPSPLPDQMWTLNSAKAINDQGQITGTGTIGGQSRGYIATPVLMGDADGNGTVDLRDAVLVAQTAAGQAVMINAWAADIAPDPSTHASGYGDGSIDLQDAIAILRKAGGL